MVNPDRNLYEPPYDDALLYDGDLEPERPRSRPLVVLLGVVVMAAFAGVVWVAYNQGVKQGQNGSPPLLTADAGPTRIVPDPMAVSPSANPAPDKSYERLWGEAPEGDGQTVVLPQPEQPRTVPAPQDVATNVPAPVGSVGGKLGTKASDFQAPVEDPRMDSTTGDVSSAEGISGGPRPLSTQPPAIFGPKPQAEDITSALPPVESVSPPVAAPRALTPAAPKPAVAKPATVTQLTPTAPSVAKPLPPITESVPVAPPVQKPATALVETTESAPVAEAPAASGGKAMIQLGSFPNDGLAASAWSKIKSSNQGLLGNYSPSIKPAEIPGKGTWYRLRVGGFADKAAAADVCEQLKASGQACIVAAK